MLPTVLDEYLVYLEGNNPAHRKALESSYHEASRIMSANGLHNYLQGIRALHALGRGHDLVLSYIQEMPQVTKAIDEAVIPDIVTAIMKLASHTSGGVLAMILTNLPMAARRLGDPQMMQDYLRLLHNLAAKAPRGLRPLMDNLDELLGKLTLGGLRRWALWGANAYARDLDGQIAFFGLQTPTSQAILQKERRGTLFVDQHRKLNYYLRALWGRGFLMRPTAGDYEDRHGLKPFIEHLQIHLPDAFDTFHHIHGTAFYQAACTHCAAHIIYTQAPIHDNPPPLTQRLFVDLFEDARVEYLAGLEFPGLKKQWAQIINAASEANWHPTIKLMMRMAKALSHPPACLDLDDPIKQQAVHFYTRLTKQPDNNHIAWQSGIDFYHWANDHTQLPAARLLQNLPIPYRDDNRYTWNYPEENVLAEWESDATKPIRKYVSPIEMANEVDCELAGDDAQETWVCSSEFFPYEDRGVSYNTLWGKEPVSEPFHYDEWDYRVQLTRPNWTVVIEQRQPVGESALMDELFVKHKRLATRIRHLIDMMQPQAVIRQRGYEEGEALDLNAAVEAMIDIRRQVMPDPKINIRITRQLREFAIILLLDLSQSSNEKIGKLQEEDINYAITPSLLDITREATGLLSWAVHSIGDPFAVHGFASNGRHDVRYYRFKDFDQDYNEQVKARLAGMQGELSTRMGAALRHAATHLSHQNARKKLILLITDGEPADIDERDPKYLHHDAKKAVEILNSKGIYTFCLTLDPQADPYVSHIFGENNYTILDKVTRLPQKLPDIFSALTR